MFRPGVESPYPHGPVAPPAPPAYDGEPRPRRPRRRPARRTALAVALGVTLVLGAACSSSGASTAPTTLDHTAAAAGGGPGTTDASQLARARAATARYATDLDAAKADGYRIITPMMADMGYHFLNPAITGFDVEKPPILVYVHTGDAWQLGALEWLFPTSRRRLRSTGRPTARSVPPATTTTGRSSSPMPKPAAHHRAPARDRRSCSGTRRWSRCTCGSGIPTRTDCSRPPTRSSLPSTTRPTREGLGAPPPRTPGT